MQIPSSPGDALDRLVILALKSTRIDDPERVAVAQRHHAALRRAWTHHGLPAPSSLPSFHQLMEVNGQLWEVEDALRAHEADGRFDEAFVALARRVYQLNDRRAALKAAVDARFDAEHPEVKSYGTARDSIST